MEKSTISIGVRLPKEYLPDLRRAAEADGRSVAGFIRQLIRQALEEARKTEAAA